MSSYRSGSVGRFDYSHGSSGSSSGNNRYRPNPSTSSFSTSRYSSSSTATPSAGIPRSFRAASYDPFSDSSRSTVAASYRSPYNRETTASTLDRPSASSTSMSNSYSDYTSKSRYSGSGISDRYGSDRYKPMSSTSMSSSYTSALPSSSLSSAGRYKSNAITSTTTALPPSRSTSYASGLAFEPSSSSRYGGISSRTGTTGMSSSTYTPSTSSYYSRPRIDYRSQTPSSITREPPTTSRFDREYRSMSRFDTKEPSVDRVEETFSKLYNRYVRGAEVKTAASSSSSSTTSSAQNSPIVKKFISHSEAEEEFSCESEPEINSRESEFKKLQKSSKDRFTLSSEKEKTPTPGTAAPNKNITSAPKQQQPTIKDRSKSPTSTPKPTTSSSLPKAVPFITAATTKIAATVAEKTPDKGITIAAAASTTKKPISTTPKAVSPAPISSSTKASPALTKASFEEKYKDLPATEVKIEPRALKGTSELDKLLRIAEFEKNPKSIISAPLPKVIQSAVKASTPAPAKAAAVEKPIVKASSEAPISAATVKLKETIKAAVPEVKKAPESAIKKEVSERPRSRSKSPAPIKSSSAAPEKQTLASKRAQRRERTLEMEKYVQNKLEAKQEQESADKVTELPKVTSERKPPLLLITQPSVPSTPISLSANIVWNSSNADVEDESEWDEDEEEDEEEEAYSEEDYDFTISLPSTGAPKGDLYPVDDTRLRSITPFSDYDSEFEIPFIQPDSRNDSRGRVASANAAPAPIFVASVTYDGDEWGSKNSADSDPDESQYFTVGSRLGVDSAGSRTFQSPADFPSEDEFLDNVDVGCTLTLVEKAALKGSDEETDSEFYSEYSDEEEEYTDEEYSYYEEEEEYYTDEEVDEEWDEDIDMTASLYLPPTYDKSPSPEPRRAKTPEPIPTKTEAKKEIVKVKTPESKAVTKEKTPEPSKKVDLKKEKTPEPSSKTAVTKEKTPEPKKASEIKKDKTPEPKKVTTDSKGRTPEPSSKVEPKKSEIQKEKTPEPKKVADVKKDKTPEPTKTITKEKTPESKTKTVTKIPESSAPKATTAVPKIEDKSAIRKSTLNMAEEEKRKAEEKQAEIDRRNARTSGAVSSMLDRFRDPTPPKQEKITYRRSKLLQAREEIRPRKKYAPIVKPVLDDEFDKQMEELREKMRKGSSKLQAEYTNLSKGINSDVDERKLKTLENKHKDLLGSSQSLLTKAEEEKKRWLEQHESEIEKQYRNLEKEKTKKVAEEEKKAALLAHPEPKRTVRRSKKKAEEVAAKTGISDILSPEGAIKRDIESVATPPAPKVPVGAAVKKEAPSPALPSKIEGPKNSAIPAFPGKLPTFKPETKKEESDLESIAAAMATKKPGVSGAVLKSEAGGVASRIKKNQASEKALSPTPGSNEAKESPEKVERGPRRYSARRKTEEIIPPSIVEPKEKIRKRKNQPHRKNRFTKKPFDIDALLGWEKENETFEKMEAFFEKQTSKREPSSPLTETNAKKRRIEAQKVWISDLKDIDKIYKASELRDIKMTAVS